MLLDDDDIEPDDGDELDDDATDAAALLFAQVEQIELCGLCRGLVCCIRCGMQFSALRFPPSRYCDDCLGLLSALSGSLAEEAW